MSSYKNLFVVTFFEKFSFNGLKSILILYAVKILHMDVINALDCIGAALCLTFLTPILGGFLADRIKNPRIIIILGLCFTVSATMLLFYSHGLQNLYFLISLTFLVVGAGLIRSNIPTLVGIYQKKTDQDLFMKYYIVINVGSLLGVICCGLISETYGWRIGFLLAISANIIALLAAFRIKMEYKDNVYDKNTVLYQFLKILLASIPILLFTYYAIIHPKFFSIINSVLLIIIAIYLLNLVFITKELSRHNFTTFVIIALTHFVFLGLYEQGNFSIILFVENYVDRTIPDYMNCINFLDWKRFPISGFKMIDPMINILLGGAIAAFWRYLTRKKIPIDLYIKFIAGLLSIVLAFCFIYFSIDNTRNITLMHIGIVELMLVIGELCIIPTCLRFVNGIAPPRIKSLFMGIWFMGMGFSQWLALNLAKFAATPLSGETCTSIMNYKQSFLMFSYMALGVMAVLIIVKMAEHVYVKRVV